MLFFNPLIKKLLSKYIPSFLLNFYRRNLKKFHGNQLLDKKMLNYINYRNGFYIEMGAHDGIVNSNTYYYEKKLNWKGILVEPSNYFKNLKENRSSKNYFYPYVAVPFNFKKKEISFEQIGPYSRSNELISSKYLKWHKSKSNTVFNTYGYEKIKKVKTIHLNEILKKTKAPKLIDFFSLDVEGSELSVLNGVNFKEFNFQYLLIEITNIDSGKHVKTIVNFLKNKRYILINNLTSYDYLFKYSP